MRRLFEYIAASVLYFTCVGAAIRFWDEALRGASEARLIFVFAAAAAGFMAYYLLDRFGDGILTEEGG